MRTSISEPMATPIPTQRPTTINVLGISVGGAVVGCGVFCPGVGVAVDWGAGVGVGLLSDGLVVG